MSSDQLLYILLALASVSCSSDRPQRPNPDLTSYQYAFMRETDFVGHKSFLLGDNVFHNLLLFLGFAMLTAIRNLPTTMTVFSILLFLVSLFYIKWITHASYTLFLTLVLLISDVVMNLHCLVLSVLHQSAVPLSESPFDTVPFLSDLLSAYGAFWSHVSIIFSSWIAPSRIYILVANLFTNVASWSLCSAILDFVSRSFDFLLSPARSIGSYVGIATSGLSEKTLRFCALYGGLAMLDALLIILCLCLLFRIKKTTSKIFYLKESYCYYTIFVAVRILALFHSPLSPSNIFICVHGLAGRYALSAALGELFLYTLICYACHFILINLYQKHLKGVTTEK